MKTSHFSRAFVSLAAALLLAGSAFAIELEDIDIPYEEFRLDNGLRVLVHTDRLTPVVSMTTWYHVGSKNEPEGKTGFAHLFEHLMFQGSENYNEEYFKAAQRGRRNRNQRHHQCRPHQLFSDSSDRSA